MPFILYSLYIKDEKYPINVHLTIIGIKVKGVPIRLVPRKNKDIYNIISNLK
jgi:hypothetical protein